jgi:hypothetical protein
MKIANLGDLAPIFRNFPGNSNHGYQKKNCFHQKTGKINLQLVGTVYFTGQCLALSEIIKNDYVSLSIVSYSIISHGL